jgi:glycosyltransferase involved in cell wall biosynthesis
MKILLVNYHYFINGGPDRYFFNIKSALESNGHEVISFSFNYDETLDTKYREYFPEPVTGRGPCMFSQQRLTKWQKIQSLFRLFVNKEVENKFRRIVREQKPDLVYSIYLSSTLLPSIFKIAKEEFRLPVLYRLSDYHLFCPAYLFCRDGHACTDCHSSLSNAIKYRCVKGSWGLSAIRACQMKYLRWRNDYRYIDAFISPSDFMISHMRQYGINEERLIHIPTFSEDLMTANNQLETIVHDHLLFLGNVSREKGIEILLQAYCQSDCVLPLEIVGKYEPDYINHLKKSISADKMNTIHFRGFMGGDDLIRKMKSARILVHPAIWYENMPNSVIEMMSLGKPIIASNHGSMPELVRNGYNGLSVRPGDIDSLKHAINTMSKGVYDVEYGRNSRKLYEENHTEKKHLDKLLGVFEQVKKKGN